MARGIRCASSWADEESVHAAGAGHGLRQADLPQACAQPPAATVSLLLAAGDGASVSYRPCVVRQRSHWGPWGAAGILPFTVTADGRAWVLLSHRSPHVQAGDSWSCFGGAMDEGETPWQAAARETGEEIGGIAVDAAGILGEYLWECPERCGWSYRTFVVRVLPHSGGRLPRVRVADGAHAWETSELAWVPAGRVTAGRQLHPAFADAWPALRERIDASVRASAAPANRDEHAVPEEMAHMTGNDPAGSTPP